MSYETAYASYVQIASSGWTPPKGEEPIEDFALVFDSGSDGCVIEGTSAELLALAATITANLSIDARLSDNYVCVCGNEPSIGGWDRVLPDGTALDRHESPTGEQETAWAEHRQYVCCDCGAVVSAADRDALTDKDDAPGLRLPILRYDALPTL